MSATPLAQVSSGCAYCVTYAQKGDGRADLLVTSEPTTYWQYVDERKPFDMVVHSGWDLIAFPYEDSEFWRVRVIYTQHRRCGQYEVYQHMCIACLKVIIGKTWGLANYR